MVTLHDDFLYSVQWQVAGFVYQCTHILANIIVSDFIQFSTIIYYLFVVWVQFYLFLCIYFAIINGKKNEYFHHFSNIEDVSSFE